MTPMTNVVEIKLFIVKVNSGVRSHIFFGICGGTEVSMFEALSEWETANKISKKNGLYIAFGEAL